MRHSKIIAAVFVLVAAGFSITMEDSSAACLQPPSGLVSWWPGDGKALDIIGSNNGDPLNGVTYAPGKVGQAFSFDGIDDEIYALGSGIDDLKQLTIEAWVKHNSLPTDTIQRYVSLSGEKAVLRYRRITGASFLHEY